MKVRARHFTEHLDEVSPHDDRVRWVRLSFGEGDTSNHIQFRSDEDPHRICGLLISLAHQIADEPPKDSDE